MRLLLSITLSLALAVFVAGCGTNHSSFGDAGDVDGDIQDGTTGNDACFGFACQDGGSGAEAGCVNLQCQQTCASTTISGKVYDPAGVNGLYNVFVYVPNAPLDPITDGPVCTQCQAPASGNPVVSATTDAQGNFTITNAPVGTNIPLVLQLGKWRRHITIANVASCAANAQPDKSLRLPKKQHETSPDDNIPLMALTTGCDGAECFFLSRVGIDPSEFTGSNGTGRVRVYKSNQDNQQTFPGIKNGALTADNLWNNDGEMLKYDIVFDACECATFTRGTNGYKNFLAYLNTGGRAFTTHYFYNFFASQAQCGFDATCQGPSPLPTVGAWEAPNNAPFATKTDCPNGFTSCLNIDVGIPKGKALADWYLANNPKIAPAFGNEAYGYCGLTDIRNDMGKLDPTLVTAGTATPWLYAGNLSSTYDAYYFSFNTPVGTNPTNQCGRAIYSDVHLAESPFGAFPSYCAANPNTSDHAPNELALEFLFFDLASCVQNDTLPPPVPH